MPIQQTGFTLKCDLCMREEITVHWLRTMEEVKGVGRDRHWVFLPDSKTKSNLCFCDFCVGRVLRNAYEAGQERQRQYRGAVDENRKQNQDRRIPTPTVGTSSGFTDRTTLGDSLGTPVK